MFCLFSLAVVAIAALPMGFARADYIVDTDDDDYYDSSRDVNIQTSNTQMQVGRDGVFIRTAPRRQNTVYRSRYPQPRVYGTYGTSSRINRNLGCRTTSKRSSSRRGGQQIYTSSSSTVCN